MKKPDPLFFIIMGALTALFLPFALAYPRTLLEKLGAVTALVLLAAGVAALVLHFRKNQRNQ